MQTAAPMRKIGESHDAASSDTQHFIEHFVWLVEHLECVGHDDNIETVIGEVPKTRIHILLNDIDTPRQSLGNIVGIDL